MTDVEKNISGLLSGSLFVLIGNVLGTGAVFASKVLVARHLGAKEYGILVLSITILNFLTIIALFGIPEGLAALIPREDKSVALFYDALLICVPISGLLTLLLIVNEGRVENLLSVSDLNNVLSILLFSLPFFVFTEITVGVFRGLERIRMKIITNNISNQGILLLGVIFAIYFGFGVSGIAVIWVVSILVSSATAAFLVSKIKLPTVDLKERAQFHKLYSLLAFSTPLLISRGIWKLIQQSDTFIIGIYHGSNVIGAYDAAFTLSQILFMVLGTVGFLFLPMFTRIKSDSESADRFFKTSTKWVGFLALPIYLSFIFFPGFYLANIFGQSYLNGASVLPIVATGLYFHILLGQNSNALIAYGSVNTILRGNVLAFLVNIALNFALIPSFGMIGAGVASACSYGSVNIYLTFKLYRNQGIQPISFSYVKPIITTVIITTLSYYFIQNVPINVGTVYEFAFISVISVLSLVLSIFVLNCIDPQDRRIFHQIIEDRS